jgi:hypothetical protein
MASPVRSRLVRSDNKAYWMAEIIYRNNVLAVLVGPSKQEATSIAAEVLPSWEKRVAGWETAR